jgi:ABC-type Fe3+/spermidine/putrescine transport system ATPase subunit
MTTGPDEAIAERAAPNSMESGMSGNNEPLLRLREVRKSFGRSVVLPGVSLEIPEGEFISFLGPSGCGKTTLLRIIAGFEDPDSGSVRLGGDDLLTVPAHKRPVNLVFQHATLFPHLDVRENIAFGLRLARSARDEIAERVRWALDLVGLPGFEDRDPGSLSGGQAQRVALARAIVNRPKVLLLDEPLSALDLQIRRQLQVELKDIHRELGSTFVYVTHDQEEAMTMSDRIVLMNEGRIEQAGPPSDLYWAPESVFVASFVGVSNLWRGRVVEDPGRGGLAIDIGDAMVPAPSGQALTAGQDVDALLRPESIALVDIGAVTDGQVSLPGVISDVQFVGPVVRYRVQAADRSVTVVASSARRSLRQAGAPVLLTWHPADTILVGRPP